MTDVVDLTTSLEAIEIAACWQDPKWFMRRHVMIEDATARAWVPLDLWPAQADVIDLLQVDKQVIMLKARQIGLTWLCVAWCLWSMLFRPAATVLLFSRRQDEAINLLDDRMKGMYRRLPPHLQAQAIIEDNGSEWTLSNGSVARAFPTTGGDSYTASIALVDEADLIPDLDAFMASVKPTIDAGGQLIMISRADKATPSSAFKRIYRSAVAGTNPAWRAVFLPWTARPDRTSEWYERQKADVLARTGVLDELHEQYPATDVEALAARSLDKRIPAAHLAKCFKPIAVILDTRTDAEKQASPEPPVPPSVPGLVVYEYPSPSRQYFISGDPAEGNPNSDDSASTIVDENDVEVASFAGKFEPAVFASYIDQVGTYFNLASAMIERNNHGHAVLLWLRDNSHLPRLVGHDGKEGWLSNSKGKALMYAAAADAFRDGSTTLRTSATQLQLATIEASTLLAPEGDADDRADSFALCLARHISGYETEAQTAPGLYS